MENPIEKKTKYFKGAGYLIGLFVGSVTAVLFVVVTGVEALIGSIAAAVSIPVGMGLEAKFRGKTGENKLKGKNLLITFLVLGFVFLVLAIVANIQI